MARLEAASAGRRIAALRRERGLVPVTAGRCARDGLRAVHDHAGGGLPLGARPQDPDAVLALAPGRGPARACPRCAPRCRAAGRWARSRPARPCRHRERARSADGRRARRSAQIDLDLSRKRVVNKSLIPITLLSPGRDANRIFDPTTVIAARHHRHQPISIDPVGSCAKGTRMGWPKIWNYALCT